MEIINNSTDTLCREGVQIPVTPAIDILLATYNGGKYLRQQLDSIIGQTNSTWRLIIRDDGSTDNTLDIIEEYWTLHPDHIILMHGNGENIGVVRNFSLLLDLATADYVMFCDQDDIWLPEKITSTLEKMLETEKQYGNAMPLLIFTDLIIVDEDGSGVRADSFWEYQQLEPDSVTRLNRLLLQNIPTGCTIMINRALREKGRPIPAEAAMHDWWLTLVAAVFGSNVYLPQATVRYRQHGMNVCGVERWSLLKDVLQFLSPTFRRKLTIIREQKLSSYRKQASAFVRRFCTELPHETGRMITVFATLDSFSIIMQKYYILKYRFFYSNGFVTAAMVLFRW
jgi:glycosyltransferase involved in cell wall biosynthesis